MQITKQLFPPSADPLRREMRTHIDGEGLLICDVCQKPLQMNLATSQGVKCVPIMCDCMIAAQKQEEAAKKKKNIRGLSSDCFQYAKYSQFTFASDDGRYGEKQFHTAKKYCSKLPDIDYGLLLYGPPDAGKTFLCACIANQAIADESCRVMMRSVPYLLSLSFDETKAQVKRMKSTRLLILDDLGSERGTEFAQEIVYDVIDTRDASGLPTIVSTNHNLEQMTNPPDITQARIFRRVLHMCYPMKMDTGRNRIMEGRYKRMKAELDG